MDTFIGQTIKGYAIQDHISQGVLGIVYRAYQPVVDRKAAIKVIVSQYGHQSDGR